MKTNLSDCGKKLIITKEIDLNGDLDLRGTEIKTLPKNLTVKGEVYE